MDVLLISFYSHFYALSYPSNAPSTLLLPRCPRQRLLYMVRKQKHLQRYWVKILMHSKHLVCPCSYPEGLSVCFLEAGSQGKCVGV